MPGLHVGIGTRRVAVQVRQEICIAAVRLPPVLVVLPVGRHAPVRLPRLGQMRARPRMVPHHDLRQVGPAGQIRPEDVARGHRRRQPDRVRRQPRPHQVPRGDGAGDDRVVGGRFAAEHQRAGPLPVGRRRDGLAVDPGQDADHRAGGDRLGRVLDRAEGRVRGQAVGTVAPAARVHPEIGARGSREAPQPRKHPAQPGHACPVSHQDRSTCPAARHPSSASPAARQALSSTRRAVYQSCFPPHYPPARFTTPGALPSPPAPAPSGATPPTGPPSSTRPGTRSCPTWTPAATRRSRARPGAESCSRRGNP